MYSIFETELNVQSDYGSHHGDKYAKFINLVALARQQQLNDFYKLPIDEIEACGYTLIISTAHINFIRNPQEGEELLVKTQVDTFSGSTCNVNFWIHKKINKKLVADGYFVYSLVSSSGRSEKFPDDFVDKMSI